MASVVTLLTLLMLACLELLSPLATAVTSLTLFFFFLLTMDGSDSMTRDSVDAASVLVNGDASRCLERRRTAWLRFRLRLAVDMVLESFLQMRVIGRC